uniref:hypothetical protein n=1 Tax=Ningiella ruwaisensis TaxID=2364274 RepID=UPI00109FFBC3|nr:hypothetical protein [Ningiella ruwaisensis]
MLSLRESATHIATESYFPSSYPRASDLKNTPTLLSTKETLVELSHEQRLSFIDLWLRNAKEKQHMRNTLVTEGSEFNLCIGSLDAYANASSTKSHVVLANSEWEVVCPSHAFVGHQTFIRPKQDISLLPQCSVKQRNTLEQLLVKLATRYDNLFMTTLGCKLKWNVDRSSGRYVATYEPLGIGKNMLMWSNHERFIQQLTNLSDIHFRDIFCG